MRAPSTTRCGSSARSAYALALYGRSRIELSQVHAARGGEPAEQMRGFANTLLERGDAVVAQKTLDRRVGKVRGERERLVVEVDLRRGEFLQDELAKTRRRCRPAIQIQDVGAFRIFCDG